LFQLFTMFCLVDLSPFSPYYGSWKQVVIAVGFF
jgi:hypothetical protein